MTHLGTCSILTVIVTTIIVLRKAKHVTVTAVPVAITRYLELKT